MVLTLQITATVKPREETIVSSSHAVHESKAVPALRMELTENVVKTQKDRKSKKNHQDKSENPLLASQIKKSISERNIVLKMSGSRFLLIPCGHKDFQHLVVI